MGSLIRKDFAIQKKSFLTYLFLGLVFFFTFNKGPTAVSIAAFVIVYGFMNRSMHEDERNHNLRLLAVLPVSRRSIVAAKYASIAIVAICVQVVFTAMGYGLGTLETADSEAASLVPLTLAAFLLIFTLMISVYLPLAYKLGAIKAQLYNRFMFVFLFSFGMAAGFVSEKLGQRGTAPGWLLSATRVIESLDPMGLAGVLLLVAALLYTGSMLLSFRIFEKRELF